MAPPASQSKQGAGNLLTRKVGPLPGWGWLVVAIVGFYLWKKLQGGSSSSGTSSTGTSSSSPPTASVTLPGGYSYSGPASGVQGFQQSATTSGGSQTATATTAPGQGTQGTSPGSGAGSPGTYDYTAETYQVGGLLPGAGMLGTPVPGLAGGMYSYIGTPAEAQQVVASGGTLYSQPTAGSFVPVSPGITPGTPEYLKAS